MASVVLTLASLIARVAWSDNNPCGAPVTRQLSDLVSVGQYLYRNGKYNESYRLFSRLEECLGNGRNDCIYYRVKCLLKLGRFAQALQLTLVMDETNSDASSRWCFMASELFLRQHNIKLARDWLYRAIDAHQFHGDEDYEMWGRIIQEKLARSNTARSENTIGAAGRNWDDDPDDPQAHRVDFVQTLPYDLITMVFEQVSLVDRVVCIRVSRRWSVFITENTALWQDMDFCNTPIPVELPTFLVYLSRLQGTPLKYLKIHNDRVKGDALISSVASSKCYQLHTLDLHDLLVKPLTFHSLLKYAGPTLRVLRWSGFILKLGDILTNVAESCPRLVELDVSYCFTSSTVTVVTPGFLEPYGACLPKNVTKEAQRLPSLSIQILRLSNIHELAAPELASILHRVPKVTQLDLVNCFVSFVPVANMIRQCCPLLNRVTYRCHSFAQQLSVSIKGPSIPMISRNWRVIRLRNAETVSDTIFRDMIVQCDIQKLHTLDLGGNIHLTDQALISLLRCTTSLPHLLHLYLPDCKGLTEKGLLTLLGASPNLETINMAGLMSVTDIVLDMTPVARLHTVDLRRCSRVTGKGVMSFVDRRQATLVKVDLSRDLISSETLGYVMRKIKYNNI